MDKNEAKELLSFHSTRNEDIDNMKWEKGFLGSLRPFRRELYEENFFEVMECLRALKDEFSGIAIEKDIISDIVAIIHYPRVWLAPEGMLGSNHLLTEEQNKHLLAWTDIIESCFMFLLEDDVYFYYCSPPVRQHSGSAGSGDKHRQLHHGNPFQWFLFPLHVLFLSFSI